MLKKLLYGVGVYLFFAFFTWGEAAGYLPPPASPFPAAENPFYADTLHQRLLNYFTRLRISGQDIDVEIKTGVPQSQITLIGDPRDLAEIVIQEKNETLTIYPHFGYPTYGRVHLEISTRFLNDLMVKDYTGYLQALDLNTPYLNVTLEHAGTVLLNGKIGLNHLTVGGSGTNQIHGIDSHSVQIRMEDNPRVDLTGVAGVESVEAEGAGHLRLYWVNSNNLFIRQSGETYIELAGIANNVDLEVEDKGHFNGRYLRVKNGHAKTYDTAIADLQFLKTQAVLANDNSLINFYGKPSYQADFMGRNGAVLDRKNS